MDRPYDTPRTLDEEYEIETQVSDIHDAYRRFLGDGLYAAPRSNFERIEDHVDDLDVSGEALYRFCDRHDFREHDWFVPGSGYFVQAVIDQLDVDEIALPDMTHVRGVGYRSETDIHIEGRLGASYPLETQAEITTDDPYREQ